MFEENIPYDLFKFMFYLKLPKKLYWLVILISADYFNLAPVTSLGESQIWIQYICIKLKNYCESHSACGCEDG